MDSTDEPVELVERVAALDLGKVTLIACVRVAHEERPGRRRQEIREYATLSRSLLELADWLRCERVELVAMEATSDCWKPVFYLLEAEGWHDDESIITDDAHHSTAAPKVCHGT